MKKLLIVIMLLSCSKCYASLFGITDSIFKKQTTEITTELSAIKNLQLNNNMEVGTFKNSQLQMARDIDSLIKLNVNLSAKMVGLDNSISTKLSAGRDAISGSGNVNDTKLMMYIIKGLIGLCSSLIVIISLTVKSLFKQMDSARFYQMNVAKLSKNGEFENMMQQKKIWEKEKSILTKSINLIKQGKDFIKNGGAR